MGAAYSILSMSTKEAKEKYSHFTEEERKENEAAEKIQLEVVEIASNYFYYGMPVKVNKQSADPLSPVWLTADTKEMKERLDAQQRQSTSTGGSRTIISLGEPASFIPPSISSSFTSVLLLLSLLSLLSLLLLLLLLLMMLFFFSHTHAHTHTYT